MGGLVMSSIPLPALHVQPPQQENILDQFARIHQIRQMQQTGQIQGMQLDEAKRAQAEDAAFRQAVQEAGGDIRKALPKIMQVAPTRGMAVQKHLAEWDKLDAQGKTEKLKAESERLGVLGQLAGSIRDQASYEAAIQQAVQIGAVDQQTAQQMLQTPYNPQMIESFRAQALTAKQQIDAQQAKLAQEETARHNREIEVPSAEREFQAFYKTWLEANQKPKNARSEMEARDAWKVQKRPSQLLTPEEEAQKARLAQAGKTPRAPTEREEWMRDHPGATLEDYWKAKGTAAPTAEMRNKEASRKIVETAINQLEELSKRVITEKQAVVQRAKSAGRSVDAALANDPDYRTYQDARMALAGNLAVAQQGSRPSDADVRSIWLPLVPDMFRDTTDSARMKWELIRVNSGLPTGKEAPAAPSRPRARNPQTGAEVEWDGKAWVPVKTP